MGRESTDRERTRPLVSIIMPAWRAVLFIDRAIESVINQNFPYLYELVIVDDGSDDKDRTWNKIMGWKRMESVKKNIVIQTHKLDCNCGPGFARHLAIAKSSGKYICYLDADDELCSSRILGAVKIFEQNPKADVVLSNYYIIENRQHILYDPSRIIWKVHEILQKRNVIIPLGVMHTREIYDKTTGWPQYLVCGEDGILWRRMSEVGAVFDVCGFTAGIYRVRKQSQSRTQRKFDSGRSFAYNDEHPDGSHGQYLDNLSDEELSQYFKK